MNFRYNNDEFAIIPLKSAGMPSGGYPGYTKKGRQNAGDLF